MELTREFKGYPPTAPALSPADVAARQWSVLQGDLALPLAVLKRSALAHNLAWMQDFCEQRGLSLAPHGKTTMSPELWAMQLAHGAWGISFATVWQAAQGLAAGVPRVLIANQVVQEAELASLAALLDTHPGAQAWFLVDSPEQVDAIERWREHARWPGRFNVLLELGLQGKRTGVRAHAPALALARRIAASPALALCGLECYEGLIASCDDAHDRAETAALMDRLDALARAAVAESLLAPGEVLLSAGGSSIFDLVALRLKPDLGRPVRAVLRSGCYLTHDHVHYHRHLRCMALRLQLSQTLQPALEVLAAVQSAPEPGLALLSMGKRDVSHDLDLPLPLWRAQPGDPAPVPVPAHWQITALNDQHAYLRFDPACPPDERPRLRDIVGCGISHPCTTFDKWRWMPVVDDAYRVVDAITTRF